MPCGDIQCVAFHSNFSVRLVDKSTGNNLLFGVNPLLTSSDIKFYYNAATQFPINKHIDTINETVNLLAAKEIMGLQLKSDPVKQINIKTFCEDGCCSRTAVEIMYDGELLTADDKKIFTIKL